jgi:hypothetical protein
MNFTSPYKMSRDYALLFDLIAVGHEVPCFVDYTFRDNQQEVYREICRVRRRGKFDISFGARGIDYGDITSWHKENGERETDAFFDLCERLNVEFIEL